MADDINWGQGGASYSTILAALQNIVTAINAEAQIYKNWQPLVQTLQPLVPVAATPLTSSLGADVALNNTGNYFDGPSIAQGTTGTWWVFGSVTLTSPTALDGIRIKLWDGTNVIASTIVTIPGANNSVVSSLSGFVVSPAGNLRISCLDANSVNGLIKFNFSGNSKDSTISAYRIA